MGFRKYNVPRVAKLRNILSGRGYSKGKRLRSGSVVAEKNASLDLDKGTVMYLKGLDSQIREDRLVDEKEFEKEENAETIIKQTIKLMNRLEKERKIIRKLKKLTSEYGNIGGMDAILGKGDKIREKAKGLAQKLEVATDEEHDIYTQIMNNIKYLEAAVGVMANQQSEFTRQSCQNLRLFTVHARAVVEAFGRELAGTTFSSNWAQ